MGLCRAGVTSPSCRALAVVCWDAHYGEGSTGSAVRTIRDTVGIAARSTRAGVVGRGLAAGPGVARTRTVARPRARPCPVLDRRRGAVQTSRRRLQALAGVSHVPVPGGIVKRARAAVTVRAANTRTAGAMLAAGICATNPSSSGVCHAGLRRCRAAALFCPLACRRALLRPSPCSHVACLARDSGDCIGGITICAQHRICLGGVPRCSACQDQ